MDFETDAAPPAGDGDRHDEIAHLEARLEALAEQLARCRKFRLAAQAALAGGVLWLVGMVAGLLAPDPVALMVALAAVIGGIVTYGSNSTTTAECEAEIKETEAKRAALIGSLHLRVVSARTLH